MHTFKKDHLEKLITARRDDVQLLLKKFGITAQATPEIIHDLFRAYGDHFMHEWFAMVFFHGDNVEKLIENRPRAVQLLIEKFGIKAKATPNILNDLYARDNEKFLIELFHLIATNR